MFALGMAAVSFFEARKKDIANSPAAVQQFSRFYEFSVAATPKEIELSTLKIGQPAIINVGWCGKGMRLRFTSTHNVLNVPAIDF